jgi:hypothetical protein
LLAEAAANLDRCLILSMKVSIAAVVRTPELEIGNPLRNCSSFELADPTP